MMTGLNATTANAGWGQMRKAGVLDGSAPAVGPAFLVFRPEMPFPYRIRSRPGYASLHCQYCHNEL
jgi:hypothetical protein